MTAACMRVSSIPTRSRTTRAQSTRSSSKPDDATISSASARLTPCSFASRAARVEVKALDAIKESSRRNASSASVSVWGDGEGAATASRDPEERGDSPGMGLVWNPSRWKTRSAKWLMNGSSWSPVATRKACFGGQRRPSISTQCVRIGSDGAAVTRARTVVGSSAMVRPLSTKSMAPSVLATSDAMKGDGDYMLTCKLVGGATDGESSSWIAPLPRMPSAA